MSTLRQQVGAEGEKLAAQWYEDNGYELLDRNWRCREGEIDLVMRKGRVISFVEVKTRTSTAFGDPIESVTISKQTRVRKTAIRWLTENGAPHRAELRFDVASVTNGDVLVIESAF